MVVRYVYYCEKRQNDKESRKNDKECRQKDKINRQNEKKIFFIT